MSEQQQIGTDAEQTQHREPAPSPAEHNRQYQQERPDDCEGW